MPDKLRKLTGVVLGFLILIIAGLVFYNYFGQPDSLAKESSFPPSLNGLELKEVITGPQAMTMISQLHGTDITIKEGYIASYEGSEGKIMIWLSESESPAEAQELFDVMDQKIIQTNNPMSSKMPPFTDRRTLSENGVSVIAVKGMGMENYYYKIKSGVYWIAITGVDPREVLREAIKKLP